MSVQTPDQSNGRTLLRSPGRSCVLTVCRGCCCGNPGKGRGTAASEQLARLRAAAATTPGTGFEVHISDCLGPCGHADVIVIQPSTAGRLRGGRPVWIGWTTTQGCTDDLLSWAAAGGPGIAPAPDTLELHAFRPAAQAPGRTRARR